MSLLTRGLWPRLSRVSSFKSIDLAVSKVGFDDVDDIVILFVQAIEEIQDEGPVSYRSIKVCEEIRNGF